MVAVTVTVLKWTLVISIGVAVLVIFTYVSATFAVLRSLNLPANRSFNESRRSPPLFLIWTPYFGKRNTRIFTALNYCPVHCLFTDNREFLPVANVVVFHGTDIRLRDLPKTEPWQLKHLYLRESPGRVGETFYRDWENIPMTYFNTTQTYHSSSDYWEPYVSLVRLDKDLPSISPHAVKATIKKKKFGIFALISHCMAESGRDLLIDAIANLTEVKRFGKCPGYEECNRLCENRLISEYYFYLAFENTICEEYITEKFGRFKNLIVPITLKRDAVPSHIPDESFIAVDDFCSIELLVSHLKYLMSNSTAYAEYFSWTEYYSPKKRMSAWCNLCADVTAGTVDAQDYSRFDSLRDYFPTSQCDNDFGRRLLLDRCET